MRDQYDFSKAKKAKKEKEIKVIKTFRLDAEVIEWLEIEGLRSWNKLFLKRKLKFSLESFGGGKLR